MGFLSGLLKKFGPTQVDDPFFGRITYMKMPRGRISYWEAKRNFLPTKTEIEVFVDAPAPEQAPNETEQQFFAAVCERYDELMASVESVLRPRFEEWTRQAMTKPFREEFTLTSFSIPCSALETAEWEMSFESATDLNHLFSVSFIGCAANSVSIDG